MLKFMSLVPLSSMYWVPGNDFFNLHPYLKSPPRSHADEHFFMFFTKTLVIMGPTPSLIHALEISSSAQKQNEDISSFVFLPA